MARCGRGQGCRLSITARNSRYCGAAPRSHARAWRVSPATRSPHSKAGDRVSESGSHRSVCSGSRLGRQLPTLLMAALESHCGMDRHPLRFRSQPYGFKIPRLDQPENVLPTDPPVVRQLTNGDERAGVRVQICELNGGLSRHKG
jgi:hypothetical protein